MVAGNVRKAVDQLWPKEPEILRELIAESVYACGTQYWTIKAMRGLATDYKVTTTINISRSGKPTAAIRWEIFAHYFELREWNGCIVQLKDQHAARIMELTNKINTDGKEYAEYLRLKDKYGEG